MSVPRNGRLSRRVAAAMVCSSVLGGRQQLVAFAGALVGQGRVVAAHQPLAGIVRVADLEQVLLIEQRQLQRPVLDEGLDLGGAQRADPIQLRRAQLVGMRALVSMPRSPTRAMWVSPNRVLSLSIWAAQGFRVGGVAVEHLDGDRHPRR